MKTPEKSRDKLLMAAIRFKEGTIGEGALMEIIDDVIAAKRADAEGAHVTTTVADLLCGTRVELCGRTATILGFAGAEHFHELRVRLDGTGEEESWWIGNLAKLPHVAETRSENNINIGGTLGKRVTLPDTGVLEICWRQPHGAVSSWQLRNHPHLGSRGLNKHGHDFIDDLEAALAAANQRHDAEIAHLKTLKHTLDLVSDDVTALKDARCAAVRDDTPRLKRIYDRLSSARCQVNELLGAP